MLIALAVIASSRIAFDAERHCGMAVTSTMPSAVSAPLVGIAGLGNTGALSRGQRLRASWECRLIQFEQLAEQQGI
ncbi:hypothetical protein CTTA_3402 [Comamonas testosteroni]|uniref:Uncharacterized protein n=1 Tax=Comamonas testosteroni TaxID=285 RepID=A0A5A7MF01_COMTE|nr:hypothetical protein CTTA_3402 [Comamonas testosteroni]